MDKKEIEAQQKKSDCSSSYCSGCCGNEEKETTKKQRSCKQQPHPSCSDGEGSRKRPRSRGGTLFLWFMILIVGATLFLWVL